MKTKKKLSPRKMLGKIIDLMRDNGYAIDSPYDLENFFEDFGSHSDMFDTGRFDEMFDEDKDD
jgi:hypothetical protein